jgi:hypothetical protein
MTDRVISMCYSDDGAHTFNNWRDRDLGDIGEHLRRVKWTRLGSAYDRVFEFSTSAGLIVDIIGAEIST